MSLLVSLLAAVVVFIAGWAVIKRYPTVIVLFAAGLIMIGLAILFGADSILPKNAKTTGLIWFDAIDIIRLAAIKQVAGIGMIIMVAGGFAKYMETYTDAKPGMPFFLKMKGNTVIQILEKPMA